jgi:hypothetical protein
VQFLHTLGGDIYIYVFGDRMGTMSLEGLSAAYSCTDSGDTQHGIEKIYSWYQANKLSALSTPLTFVLGASTTLTAFLGAFSADVPNINTMAGIMSFRLDLFLVPDQT